MYQFNSSVKKGEVTSIQRIKNPVYHGATIGDLYLIPFEDMLPIPLNKSLIKKYGFKFECYCEDKIKYLHQLQNIYFDLIGKEL
jgi:hypothetical protein